MNQRYALLLRTLAMFALPFLFASCGEVKTPTGGGASISSIVGHDVVDLSQIHRISRFRSSIGGDFSIPSEPCRSMRHLFEPIADSIKNKTVEVYAPIDGLIQAIAPLGADETMMNHVRIAIQSSHEPDATLFIEPIDLLSSEFRQGAKVKAGMQLGHARFENPQEPWIAVALHVNESDRISFFDAMQEYVFDNYRLRGVKSRARMIISQPERDAHPLRCENGALVEDSAIDNWVNLQ